MLRENLEEEAIIMKDVPDWKVGPWEEGRGLGCCRNTASYRKPGAEGWWVAGARRGRQQFLGWA